MEEQRSKRRTRSIIYLLVAAVVVGGIAFFVVQSSRKKARKEAVAVFYQSFNKMQDEQVNGFFKCTVRAQHVDVLTAQDTQTLTDGLEKAFANFPKSQPDYLKDKCIPMIAGIVEDLGKLKAPGGFGDAVESVKTSLGEVRGSFERYTSMIEKRKNEAANEQEIRNMNGDFHRLIEDKDAPKALAYFNLITCAVPDVVKLARGISKPPDTQPVVEYIYNTCKADPKYAEKLRKECFATANQNQKKTGDFHMMVQKMAGDARDLEAINDCFRRANHGFAQAELEDVAKTFAKYKNEAVGKVKAEMAKAKQELAD